MTVFNFHLNLFRSSLFGGWPKISQFQSMKITLKTTKLELLTEMQ